ncbi:hypothetical protein ABER61_08565 [Brevibacillus formosus]|uniref:Uncharacterized protein n=1 Tax=Brevibacillus formosus TaxID=54913 RepID=A0A837KN89_9BACL|nr:hypothetical protein [Brevibacillus formosus]KLH97709.1 hypothetical protein AA984_17710 [Brevibacillus formosus]MBW5470318.1 hypothetical protein [Brevibacillus formosus]MED1957491.1 hypothetical protein [Brevibacillus formosus]PSJ98880.1 hypothetical protein C7R91_05690 [Brevibacillus formosus]GED57604.1 hypothetical protein BFO01nite_17360 [Brevibacillus formosus]
MDHQTYVEGSVAENEKVMTMKDWIIVSLFMMIPIANIVLLFVWAFGSDGNLNRKNWAKAGLLLMAILFGLYFVFGTIAAIITFILIGMEGQ